MDRVAAWVFVGVMAVGLGQSAIVNDSTITLPLQTVVFGEILPVTGSYAVTGMQYHYGISAACHEYNTNPFRRFNIELNLADDQFVVANTVAKMQAFGANDSITAVVGMVASGNIEASAPIAAQYRKPVLPFYGGLALRKPFQKYIINFRASYFDEAAAVVEYLVSKGHSRFAAFIQNDGSGWTALAGTLAALASNNLYLHSNTIHTRNANRSVLQSEVATAIDIMTRVGVAPDVIMVIGTYDPVSFFVYRIRQIWPNVVIGGVSGTSVAVVLDLLAQNTSDANMFTNFYFGQVVPLPTDTRLPVVQRYTDALHAIGVQAVSFASFEAYITARLAISAMGRIDDNNYTSTNFINALYETSYFNLNGLRCGPLNTEEIDGGCNQCMHQVLLTVSTVNRTVVPLHEIDPFFHFSTCGYLPRQWQVLHFGQACSFNGSQSVHCGDFRDGLRAAFKQVNDAGGVRGTTKLVVDTSDDGGDANTALLTNANYIMNTSYFGLIGTSALGANAAAAQLPDHNKVMVGALTGDVKIRRPFSRNIINFRASVADEMFAIVHECFYHKNVVRISVLYEATSIGHESMQQLATALGEKRLSIWSEVGFDSQNISASVDQLFSERGNKLQGVVVIGLGNDFGAIAAAIHHIRSSVLIFGLSLTITTSLNDPVVQSKVNLNNIFLTQCVPDVTDTATLVGAVYQAALRHLDDQLVPSPFGLEGFLVGRLVATSLNRILGQELTVDNMLDAIYENGNFDLFGLRCGPLEENSNSSSKASCNQCMKKVYMTSFVNGTQRMVSTFSFDDVCMYTPHPNVDFQLGGSRLIMVVLATCGIFYTLGIMVLLVMYRTSPQVRVTSYRFSLISCAGAVVCFCGVFVLYPIPTDATCALRPWVSDVGFVTLFGPIFAKTYRIDKLFNTRKKLTRKVISDQNIFGIVIAMLIVVGGFLAVLMAIDRPSMDEAFTTLGERYEVCSNKYSTFSFIDYGMKALVLLWGCFLCQRVFNISGQFARFNESKSLVVCIYHTSFLAVCVMLVGVTTKDDPNVYFMSFSGLLVMNTLVVVTVLYGRGVFKAIRGIPVEESESSGKSKGNTASNTSSKDNHISSSGHESTTNGSEQLMSRKTAVYRANGCAKVGAVGAVEH